MYVYVCVYEKNNVMFVCECETVVICCVCYVFLCEFKINSQDIEKKIQKIKIG